MENLRLQIQHSFIHSFIHRIVCFSLSDLRSLCSSLKAPKELQMFAQQIPDLANYKVYYFEKDESVLLKTFSCL